MKTGGNYLLLWVLFCIPFCCLTESRAQPIETVKSKAQLSGYILSQDSLLPVVGASVLNAQSKQGTSSNAFGFFSIAMSVGDTIWFTSIGYTRKFFYFKRDLLAQNYNIQVLLSNDTLELKTFVYSEPSHKSKLKKEFNRYFIADSLAAFEELSRREMLKSRNLLYNLNALNHPVTYFYDRFNKQARNWRKIDRYRYIIQKAEEANKLNNKSRTDDYYSK